MLKMFPYDSQKYKLSGYLDMQNFYKQTSSQNRREEKYK